ncbi:MAG: DUF1092 family protein [Oscillatoria sp. SIO1A7]|nr:DUF1092 family protein [Oscillatoria sp. SIO1A7]
MQIWQVDFYRRPLQDERGQPLWELVACNATGNPPIFTATVSQKNASENWLAEQLRQWAEDDLPNLIQVFRPQSLSLIKAAGQKLGIPVEATRRTPALKQLLLQKAQEYPRLENYTGVAYEPLALDRPPPVPVPEEIWGERWRFASVNSGEIVPFFGDRPMPILEMPEFLLPASLGLASTLPVPGVVIDGGRQSMKLARWLQDVRPVAINYLAGAPDGLILEAGLVERWILATFEDEEVAKAGATYEQSKQQSKGLHFLLVQPDDSGMTYSGFWFLQDSKQ